ncbi:hypothetical protein M885DRAFT_211012 [Pelagophyceae sp. CCMP2097]|nr:hypothetical protein M885DRAFT_211012 [Pelagophyceae sp. CCMP2097]
MGPAPASAVVERCPGSLIGTVESSKEARRQLRSGSVQLEWVRVDDADARLAVEIEALLPASRKPRSDEASCEWNAVSKKEFVDLYSKDQLDPASNELRGPAACCVVRTVLRLAPSDKFIDLGSANGRLVLIAALGSRCGNCAGLELSSRSHHAAVAARDAAAETLRRRTNEAVEGNSVLENGGALENNERPPLGDHAQPPLGDCVHFFEGDVRQPRPYVVDRGCTVVYCAIRGATSRQKVLARVLEELTRDAPTAPPLRLICAGFGVDVSGTAYAGRVALVRAYAVAAEAAPRANNPAGAAVAMYGDDVGPRVLLEYAVHAG